jgi:hypothetical protein
MSNSRQRRFALVCIILAAALFSALFQGCASGNGQGGGTLKALIDNAKENGIQPSAADDLDRDDSIQITIQSIELDAPLSEPETRYARVSYTAWNNSGRELLMVLGGCYAECSLDGKTWYPLSNYQWEHIRDDGIVIYDMGWNISYSGGESAFLYLPEGENARQCTFVINGAYSDKAMSLEKIPDGFYRLIFRFCEYVEPNGIFDGTATLIDYGYYSVSFQIKDEKILAN